MKKHLLVVGIILLFILSSVSPLVFGVNIDSKDDFDPLSDYYGVYSLEEIPESIRPVISDDKEDFDIHLSDNYGEFDELPKQMNGPPMDSPWPMYCHDTHHTGRSPYNTIDNTGYEKWRFGTDGWTYGSPVIDDQGVIYVGASDFYAVYPNGTLKWKYNTPHVIESAGAIDENGIIYIGTRYDYPNDFLYAIYTNNGSVKWKYPAKGIVGSPAIGDDGIIVFTDNENWYIKALYPNGTLKWTYKTNDVVYSSPAIGEDGTIYCGCHDTYLYALYPNNGTLKWRYKTGNWIRTSPCIGDDGTIYVVSLDNHLHAVNPNGIQIWKTNMGQGGTSPTIGQDGTIYCGYTKLHAINPTNGSVKWTFDVDGTLRGGTPCNSIDGTIYVGTSDGGKLIAINPDGTEKWRKNIGSCESAPAIGADGTVYIGSNSQYLYAFGELDPNAPIAPIITGQNSGIAGTEYEYTFESTSPFGRDIFYYISWGDGSKKDWFGPFSSGEEVKVKHTFTDQRTYTIKSRAKDTENLWGSWGELEVNMPRDKTIESRLWLILFDLFPLLEVFLSRLINL